MCLERSTCSPGLHPTKVQISHPAEEGEGKQEEKKKGFPLTINSWGRELYLHLTGIGEEGEGVGWVSLRREDKKKNQKKTHLGTNDHSK